MIVGIDLGTTNSALAIWRDGKAELVPNSLGHVLTPSVVGLDDKGQLLVGLAARERLSTHPTMTTSAFKRYMGSERKTQLGRKSYSPEDLSATVLRSLKADAEAYLGQPVTEAVITVPAYFNDRQRKATRRAGELAGFKVERLLNEPTAAALAYGIQELEKELRFLVFDLGGGTFDVSVLEIFEGVIEVRASTGDNRLGGEDFNEVLIDRMRRQFKADWGADTRDNDGLYQRLRVAAERARRELSVSPQTKISLVWKDKAYELELSEDEFEKDCSRLMDRLREPVLRALRDSELRPSDLHEIVMVGGATRMPLVRKSATRMFGRFPSININPDEAIALGAAVQAGLKARDAALKEVVLTDVCPYSLGVEVAEHDERTGLKPGIFSPIIERNTIIPASRVRLYQPVHPGQSKLPLKVYQGEFRKVVENIFLGELSVPIPAGTPGEILIECRFTYDINGLLEVDVHVPKTGLRRELVIADKSSMSPKELEARRAELAKLKVHPRDDDANRAALGRGARCYENSLGDLRACVSDLIRQFELVIERQDPREIKMTREAFLAQLDALEGETFL